MTLNTIYETLREAERKTLDLISTSSSEEGQPIDYDRMQDYLALARRINQVYSSMEKISGFKSTSGSTAEAAVPSRTSNREKEENLLDSKPVYCPPLFDDIDSQFPMYFISDDRLYKIGSSQKEHGQLYKKSVVLSDVYAVLDNLAELVYSNSPITIGALNQRLDFPSYKIQVTIMALIECEVLVTVGRGRYELVDHSDPSPSSWMSLLHQLPERGDLLEMI